MEWGGSLSHTSGALELVDKMGFREANLVLAAPARTWRHLSHHTEPLPIMEPVTLSMATLNPGSSGSTYGYSGKDIARPVDQSFVSAFVRSSDR